MGIFKKRNNCLSKPENLMTIAVMTNLRELFGDQLQEQVVLAPYTSARIGGPADALLTARSADELAQLVQTCWQHDLPFTMLGGGSNVLVSDAGVRGIVILNRAKEVDFRPGAIPTIHAEAGTVFSNLAHRAAAKGLAGLEWAIAVPGTVGGAVYGNAGAFGGDTSQNLIRAEILTENGRHWWSAEKMEYGYRTSALKRAHSKTVVLAAEFAVINGEPAQIQAIAQKFTERRKATQPPGASMGSMFKNPPGDFAGHLIEAAGLKGTRIGNAEISMVHGNF
ncbi:MAG: UDP-N-acetylmuramate dehydrogenase, partial [Akkermansiaceae bacterium]|nr:UDP-N-acetylmuramate dehydrogenase [Verrucomicrobiales bacterium]